MMDYDLYDTDPWDERDEFAEWADENIARVPEHIWWLSDAGLYQALAWLDDALSSMEINSEGSL